VCVCVCVCVCVLIKSIKEFNKNGILIRTNRIFGYVNVLVRLSVALIRIYFSLVYILFDYYDLRVGESKVHE